MEYANINLFILPPNQTINELAVNNEIKKYHDEGILSTVIVDNDYNIIEKPEAFIAGKKLKLKYLQSSRIKTIKPFESKFPYSILLEITNRCNLLCTMCPRNQLTREEKDIDFDIFKKVVDEISQHEFDGLWLFNIGESMLHPKFFEMLNYVNRYPNIHPLWLSTNGIELNEINSQKILNSNLDFLNVSLNAMNEKSYKTISPKSDYSLILKNLNNFLLQKKKMKKRKPFLRVQMIDQSEIHDQIPDFIKAWGSKADIININQLERFFGQKEIPSNKDILEPVTNSTEPCIEIDRGFLYIYSNNRVNLCGTDFNCIYCIGDVSLNSIEEIWNSPERKVMYENIKNQKFDKVPLCYQCRDKNIAKPYIKT